MAVVTRPTEPGAGLLASAWVRWRTTLNTAIGDLDALHAERRHCEHATRGRGEPDPAWSTHARRIGTGLTLHGDRDAAGTFASLLADLVTHADLLTRFTYLEVLGSSRSARRAVSRIFDTVAAGHGDHLDPRIVEADLDTLGDIARRATTHLDSGLLDDEFHPAAVIPLYGELDRLDDVASRYELLLRGPGPTRRTRG